MLSQIISPLVLLLPLLATVDAKHRRSAHNHLNIVERHARAHDAYIKLERSLPTIENRMAKKHLGRTLARRAADGTKCRSRNSSSAVSASSTASSSASSSAVSSAAPTTTTTPAAATTTTSQWHADYVAATTSAASQSSSGTSVSVGASSGYTPNGIKAGISAGNGYDSFKDHIGWWYDWSASPSGHWGSPVAVNMLWGGGTSSESGDASRLAAFWGLTGSFLPYVMGFEEPDCYTAGSAGMSVDAAAALWNTAIVPHGNAGSVLIGPSMCHQAAESGWYSPFLSKISRQPDVTNIHVNKNSAAGIYADIDHYASYGKPIWVTEFACVDDSTGFTPCTDQNEINNFINTAVKIFESDSRIAAYAISQGSGLADNWALTTDGTTLSTTGWTYLNAIKAYH